MKTRVVDFERLIGRKGWNEDSILAIRLLTKHQWIWPGSGGPAWSHKKIPKWLNLIMKMTAFTVHNVEKGASNINLHSSNENPPSLAEQADLDDIARGSAFRRLQPQNRQTWQSFDLKSQEKWQDLSCSINEEKDETKAHDSTYMNWLSTLPTEVLNKSKADLTTQRKPITGCCHLFSTILASVHAFVWCLQVLELSP